MASESPAHAAASRPALAVEVAWGSVTETDGDVHLVGHYQGVLPQNAEAVLDKAVSATSARPIIRDLTERGIIRGALGDVNFIPWGADRMVAVAGMGAPGTFGTVQLQKLVASVAATVGHLRDKRVITSVLIGSGAGNMGIAECIEGYLEGFRDAFQAFPALPLERLRLVEISLDRAVTMLRTLEEKVAKYEKAAGGVRFEVSPKLVETKGGDVPTTFNYSMLLAAVARESGTADAELHPWLQKLLDQIPHLSDKGKKLVLALRERAKDQGDLPRLALDFRIADTQPPPPREVSTRVVFSFDGRHVRTSAITATTTVSEREVSIRPELFEDLILWLSRSNSLPAAELMSLGRFAFARLVHRDMDAAFNKPDRPPVIIELNRSIATLPFEMFVLEEGPEAKPLAVTVPLARQLRTTYSPPPISAPNRQVERALVIGDPGEGDYQLDGAREEAERVAELLKEAGVKVHLLVGSPRGVTGSLPKGSRPAGMVLTQQLLYDGVDLVHFCGHGRYEPDRPDLSGWVFGNGNILSADDLRQMRQAPLLIFANACVSAQVSQRRTGARPGRTKAGRRPRRRPGRLGAAAASDAGVIAGLADEFFRQGVRDFIGAAFDVPDVRAKKFAEEFYVRVLGSAAKAPITIGQALRGARETLYEAWKKQDDEARRRDTAVSPIWGAYQHYGDPTVKIR